MAPPTWGDAALLREEAKSVWEDVATGARTVAPATSVVGTHQPVERPNGASEDNWPPPPHPLHPIAVELVRTSDDEWHVAVDGQLCHERPTTNWANLETVPRCPLPPPLGRDKPLAVDSTTRRVVVSCRLEAEALAPASVELAIDQVVWSDERQNTSISARTERTHLDRYILSPYATSDQTAKVVVLPYPFVATPQSVLGVVSYRELELHLERKSQHKLKQKNRQTVRNFEEPTPPPEARVHAIGGKKRSAPAEVATMLQTLASAFNAMTQWELDRRDNNDTFFQRQDFGYRTIELRAEGVRYMLKERGDSAALALFDAMAYGLDVGTWLDGLWERFGVETTPDELQDIYDRAVAEDPIATADIALGPPSSASDTETIDTIVVGPDGDALEPRTADTGAVLFDNREVNARDDEWTAAVAARANWTPIHYEFLYDRLQFETRKRTMLRLEYRLIITEHDGTKRQVRVAPKEHFGHVAHAVFTGVEKDEQDMRQAVVAFQEALDNFLLERPAAVAVRDLFDMAYDIADFPFATWDSWRDWLLASRPRRERMFDSSVRIPKMKRSLKQLLVMLGYMTGPMWPEDEPLIRPAPGPQLQVVTHVRQLPQVVWVDGSTVLPSLRIPDDTEPPSEWARPVNTDPSRLTAFVTWFGAALAGLGFGAAKGFYTYVSSTIGLATTAASTGWQAGAGAGGLLAWLAGLGAGVAAPLVLTAGALGVAAAYYFADPVIDAVSRGRAFYDAAYTGLPLMFSVRNIVIDYTRRSAELGGMRKRAVERALRELRGRPVMSALVSGREALTRLRALRRVMTNLCRNGQRFQFALGYTGAIGVAGSTLHTDDVWDTALNAGLLTTKLPSEVTDALHEAVELRRVRVDEAIDVVVGNAARTTPTTVAENAAAEVHGALVLELAALRSPLRPESMLGSAAVQAQWMTQRAADVILAAYGSKAGFTCVQSDDAMWECFPGGLVARLALSYSTGFDRANSERYVLEQEVNRLNAAVQLTPAHANVQLAEIAFARQAQETERVIANWTAEWNQWQVQIDADIARGGTMATVQAIETRRDAALQPLNRQREATSTVLSETASRLEDQRRALKADPASLALVQARAAMDASTQSSWNRSRRLQIDAFVKAWVSEAGRQVKLDSKLATPGSTPMYELIQQVASSARRMLLVAGPTGDFAGIGPLVAGTAAPRVTRLLSGNDELVAAMATAESKAVSFQDQVGFRAPEPVVSANVRTAMWASRRIDTHAMVQLHNLSNT